MNKQLTDKASVRKRSIKELIIGAAVAAAGGLATFASYNSARPGGSYTVYTGIIALGIVYAVKGLIGVIMPGIYLKNQSKNQPADQPEAVAEAEVVKEED